MDTFQVAVGVILVLVQCCFVLRVFVAVIRGRAAALFFAWARFVGLEAKRCVRSLVGPIDISAGDGEIDGQVKALMTRRNLTNAARLLGGAAVFSAVRTPLLLRDVLMTGGLMGLNKVGTAASAALMVLSCLAAWAPRLVTTATLPIWHVAYMAGFCVIVSPAAGPDLSNAIVLNLIFHLASALASLVSVGPLLVSLSNLCFSACMCATFSGLSAEAPGLAFEFILPVELVIWALKLVGIFTFRRVLFQGVVQEVQASAQRCHKLAMSSVLDLICDAVVDLDAGLVMTEHFPKFANMLMHGSGRSLGGVALRDFVVDDGDGVEERLAKNSLGEGGTAMFPGRVRDSLGNRLKVVFFHVPYTTASGLRRHLLGIQEERDEAAAPPFADAPPKSQPDGEPELAPAEPVPVGRSVYPAAEVSGSIAARLERRQGPQGRGGATSASSSGSGSSVSEARVPTADIVVEEGLRIRGTNPAFVRDLGLRSGPESFLAEALPQTGAALLAWMRDRRERIHKGALPAPHIELYDGGPVTVGAARDRQIRVLFPPAPEAYAVSVRFERRRRQRDGRSVGRGTAAATLPQAIGSAAAGRHLAL